MAEKQLPPQTPRPPTVENPGIASRVANAVTGLEGIDPDSALGLAGGTGFGMEALRSVLPAVAQAGAPPEDPKVLLDRIEQLPPAARLGPLVGLLRTGWFDSVSPTERWLAMEIVE